MAKQSPFQGAMTALVTPLRDGRVDEPALARLVDEQIEAGIDGIVAVGTTGESATLTANEQLHVVELVVKQARKRVPVIAGTGSNSTAEAIEHSKAARDAGADGLLLVVPYYNKPTQEGLFRHFSAVVEACPLPSILYNVPGRTSCDLLADTVIRLAALEPVVAIKEATASMQRASQILRRTPEGFAVLSGDDFTALPLFALGGKGVISVVSNVTPAWMAQMWDAAAAGDWDRARELHFRMYPLVEALFLESNPIPVKTALAMMGKIGDEIRPPMYPMEGDKRERLKAVLKATGLL